MDDRVSIGQIWTVCDRGFDWRRWKQFFTGGCKERSQSNCDSGSRGRIESVVEKRDAKKYDQHETHIVKKKERLRKKKKNTRYQYLQYQDKYIGKKTERGKDKPA